MGFSCNRNNCGRLGANALQSECDDKQGQNVTWRAKIVNAFVLCVHVCVRGRQNLNNPKLSPMAENAITQGGIGGLGSLVSICDSVPSFHCADSTWYS